MNLNQVTLPSLDVEKATQFYITLGLRLIVDALPNYVRLECPEGESTLSIHKVESLGTGEGIVLYFENDNLDAVVTQLKQKGINFKQELEDKPWLWREAHLTDPDNNKIILFYAGHNRKNPPWRKD